MSSIAHLAAELQIMLARALADYKEKSQPEWNVFPPEPEEEQRRICELTAIDARIDCLHEVLRTLNQCAIHGFRDDGP